MIEKHLAKSFILGILSIILLIPLTTNAYTYNGYKWSANGTTVDSGDASWPWSWTSPLAAAMNTWNGTASPFTFSVGNGHKFKVGTPLPGAVATTYLATGGSTINDAMTIFNQSLNFSTTGEANKYDIQNIATHELGHWLSLGDLSGAGDTLKTMYHQSNLGETLKRTLETDDINGINYIYP
jgi:hypothetical protein